MLKLQKLKQKNQIPEPESLDVQPQHASRKLPTKSGSSMSSIKSGLSPVKKKGLTNSEKSKSITSVKTKTIGKLADLDVIDEESSSEEDKTQMRRQRNLSLESGRNWMQPSQSLWSNQQQYMAQEGPMSMSMPPPPRHSDAPFRPSFSMSTPPTSMAHPQMMPMPQWPPSTMQQHQQPMVFPTGRSYESDNNYGGMDINNNYDRYQQQGRKRWM